MNSKLLIGIGIIILVGIIIAKGNSVCNSYRYEETKQNCKGENLTSLVIISFIVGIGWLLLVKFRLWQKIKGEE